MGPSWSLGFTFSGSSPVISRWSFFILQRKQDLAHALSSRVNEAYQTLLNPLARAEYILQLNGHSISEHDQVHDLEFMSKIMDARELIDDTEDPSLLQDLLEDNDSKSVEIISN